MKKLFITVLLTLATVISSESLVTAAQITIPPLVTSQQFQAPSIMESIQQGLMIRGEIQRQDFLTQDQENKYKLQALVEDKKKEEVIDIFSETTLQEVAKVENNAAISLLSIGNFVGMCQTYRRIFNFFGESNQFVLKFIEAEAMPLGVTPLHLSQSCRTMIDSYRATMKRLEK